MGAIPAPVALHIASGARWHVADLILYGGAGLLLLAGLALAAPSFQAGPWNVQCGAR